MSAGLVWFRNNLRIHDNEVLYRAVSENDNVICIYCYDPAWDEANPYLVDVAKMGEFRKKFLKESLINLDLNLKKFGGELNFFYGKPHKVIADILSKEKVDTLYYSRETTYEETLQEQQVEAEVNRKKWNIKTYWCHTLYHLEDIPFTIPSLPDIFTQFRKKVEKESHIRDEFPIPEAINGKSLHYADQIIVPDSPVSRIDDTLSFRGGESAAWERLNHYFWKTEKLKNYKYTRNKLLGADYSSKFSPWLALGCISAKTIWHQVAKFEKQVHKNVSTYWLVFELIWRDYFWYVARKFGNRLFHYKGIKHEDPGHNQNRKLFQLWCEGNTGIPFIDANMRELSSTGFMSNRGRQNVASFLVKDLKVDWRWGAAWFESLLIDYDVHSNWGNWQYVTGIGNDPRENRYFNILSQAKKYDSKGDYVRYWIPELHNVPGFKAHTPSLLTREEQAQLSFFPGTDYPNPIINIRKWVY